MDTTMLAEPETCGVSIAEKSPGVPIPETGVAEGTLNNTTDVHFGMNSTAFNGKVTNVHIRGHGARILDIEKRGGRTAEDTWRYASKKNLNIRCTNCLTVHAKHKFAYDELFPGGGVEGIRLETDGWIIEEEVGIRCKNCGCDREFLVIGLDPLRGSGEQANAFENWFREFNLTRPVKKRSFPSTARMNGKSIGGQNRGYVGDTKFDINKKVGLGAYQYGTRWSKTALEHTLESGGTIHFHLDGLGDISQLLDKGGDYAYNVTARELRYIYRNWEKRFKGHVVFYNGYTADDKAVIVEKPWDD